VSNSYRRNVNKDLDDSIADEIIDEESFQQSKAEDSIKEESIVNEIESGRTSKKESDSIAEDSIIREEYSNDNFTAHKATQGVEALNRVKFGMHS
jgi:hypothetical protein